MVKWQDAEEEFQGLFKPLGKSAFVYRFKDTREAKGVGSKRTFAFAQPADFLVTFLGSTFFAEVKSTHEETSFSFSAIRPAQWNAAVQQVAAGGLYYFFIRNEVFNRWYKVPASVLLSAREAGCKSMKFSQLQEFIWSV